MASTNDTTGGSPGSQPDPTGSGKVIGETRPHSAHWSGDRLHADVHRAVGGTLNLIRELARVSHHLDGTIPAEWMVKRMQFLSYELQAHLHLNDHKYGSKNDSESERLAALNRFFFGEQGFKCLSEPFRLPEPSSAYRLSHVLTSREGAAPVLELLYAFLAERIGVSLDFVDLKPTCFLRWRDGGRSRFIDITRSGSTLSSDELIETLHTRFKLTSFCNASLLEIYSFESYLCEYLRELRQSLGPVADPESLLFIQDTLIAYQPSNLNLIGERALLHRRLGNFKSSLSDLKRYFAFHDRSRAPRELVDLHRELTDLLEKRQ